MYTVVDLETTGLSPTTNRIIEIGAVKVADGKIQEEYFHSLVNPQDEVSLFIVSLTGIKRKELEKAPVIEEVMPDFLNFLGDNIFVAHNARFDFGFLNEELKRYYWKPLKHDVIDTIKLAKRKHPGLKSYALEALIEHFGFDHKKNHRALDDAMITAKILLKLMGDGK